MLSLLYSDIMSDKMGLVASKPDLYTNNKGADQPVHLHSLISTFGFCYLKSIVVKLAPCKILASLSIFTGWFEPSCKFRNFREGFIFAKLCRCKVS